MTDLTGHTALVTGASSGIGAVTARTLAAFGADVIPVGRSPERTAEVAASIGVRAEVADFADLAQVRALADRIRERTHRLDIVVHNAGAIVPRRTTTVDGHELTFQANHLAPFLLQALISDLVTGTSGARVIVVSSVANLAGRIDLDDLDRERRRYLSFPVYAASKLMNILFADELSRRLAPQGSSAVSVHPGTVASGFARDNALLGLVYHTPLRRAALLTAEQGADPLLRLATRPDIAAVNGQYFQRFRSPAPRSPAARDRSLALGLWQASEVLADVAAGPPLSKG